MKHPVVRVFALSLVLTLSCFAAPIAQEISIRQSSGTAELLLPFEGWRQAVSGRLVPVGASVAVWAGGTVVIERSEEAGQAAVQITAGPLTVITVTNNDTQLLEITLIAGSVSVATTAANVAIVTDFGTIASQAGEYTVLSDSIEFTSGSLTITYPDEKVRQIDEGGRISLLPVLLAPVIHDR